MMVIKVSAPGKLHLLGEHAIVYNKPAILTAVDRRCAVEITPRTDNKIKVSSKNFNKDITLTFEEIVKKFDKSQKDWEKYDKSNNVNILKSITEDPLDLPLIIIGQFINNNKLNSISGFDLTIDSEIPVGGGMGSSGALAVSIIGALNQLIGRKIDKEEINKMAFLCEQKKHGKPSGGDNSTSCYGGLVWFKKDEGLKPLDTDLPDDVSKNFYFINTGTPTETTGELVSIVRSLIEKEPKSTNAIMDDQEGLVHDLLHALEESDHDQIIEIIRSGESNLEKIGVVSSFVKKIIRDIEESGGSAKICGAGGTTKATGIILIYNQDLKNLKKVLKSHNLKPEQLALGVEGLRID